MKNIKTLKAELKEIHTTIKTLRPVYKQCQRDGEMNYEVLRPFWRACAVVREMHVAYCLLRGTPYEKIEPKVREGNEINMKDVTAIMEAYREQPEVVCGDAIGSV